MEYVPNPPELGFFDFLIANGDRNSGNFLERRNGSIVAIDHGVAFHSRESKALSDFSSNVTKLISAVNRQRQLEPLLLRGTGREKSAAINIEMNKAAEEQKLRLPLVQAFLPSKNVVEKLRATTYEDWKKLVGDFLSEVQIRQIMNRQLTLLEKIDKAESILGTELVYPKVPVRRVLETQVDEAAFNM